MITQERFFVVLWNELINKGAEKVPNNGIKLMSKDGKQSITLYDGGEFYQEEARIIDVEQGYSIIGVYVLLDKVEDHYWCWDVLRKIGLNKKGLFQKAKTSQKFFPEMI